MLAQLRAEGWRLRHSLVWGGRGDIDSVAIAPTGIAFAIETKTRNFHPHHVVGVRTMAVWLYRHRRRCCPRGALPILCVVRASGLERVQDEVLIVSLDRLVPALRKAAGTAPRPEFLAGETSRRRSPSRSLARLPIASLSDVAYDRARRSYQCSYASGHRQQRTAKTAP